jgi:hypothetical protein
VNKPAPVDCGKLSPDFSCGKLSPDSCRGKLSPDSSRGKLSPDSSSVQVWMQKWDSETPYIISESHIEP